MAILPAITIPNADVPDVVAAIEQIWMADAVRLFFGGDSAAYDAATLAVRGQALVKAWLIVTTKNYRTELNKQAAVVPGVEPGVS
jgi:hypothetical protein